MDLVRIDGIERGMKRKELKKGLEWKEGNRRRGLSGERKVNGKGTRNEWRKRIGRKALKDHKLHELIRTRE